MKNDPQQKFEAHCSEYLDMNTHLPIAQKKYVEAYELECVEVKKENSALRAMNQYLYNELKKIGWHNWRDEKPRRAPATGNQPKLSQQERSCIAAKSENMPKSWEGKILRDAGLN